jgi:hypothetical protein
MNWRRVHPEGKDPKHHKEWRGGRGRYAIIWRDQAYGVTVAPGYHTALCSHDGRVDELLSRNKRLKRTLKAAKRACELHANPSKKRK